MKKGFTLVEIIISITLILLIGVSVTFFVIKGKNNNKYDVLTNEVLEAANLYMKTESDVYGKNYNEMIQKGTKGVAITLEQLVNKGYIKEEKANEIYDNNPGLGSNQDYYVLFVNGGKGLNEYKDEYCEIGQITILPSWVDKGSEPIYLCENVTTPNFSLLNLMNSNLGYIIDNTKYAVSEGFKNDNSSDTTLVVDNGLKVFSNIDSQNVYYYFRGAVNNNYLVLGTDENNNSLKWRIVWVNTTKNTMKLVLDSLVPVYVKNSKGNEVKLNINDEIIKFNGYTFLTTTADYKLEEEYCNERYGTCRYNRTYTLTDDESFVTNMIYLENNYGTSSYYLLESKEWYEKTNLKNYSFITSSNNFCINNANYYPDYDQFYFPSKNFDCTSGSLDSRDEIGSYKTLTYYSSPVGFLTYGDLVMSGIIGTKTNIDKSGNYLMNDVTENGGYMLQDMKEYAYSRDRDRDTYSLDYANYYVGKNGLNWSYTYEKYNGVSWLGYGHINLYTLINSVGTRLFYRIQTSDSNRIESSTFVAPNIKPAIIIDLSKAELATKNGNDTNAGTEDNYYILNEKK